MPRKKPTDPEVVDRSFWVCRVCSDEVVFKEGLWRLKEPQRSLLSNDWICDSAIEPVDGEDDWNSFKLLPGFKDYYHHGQEIDPAADLQRIISEL